MDKEKMIELLEKNVVFWDNEGEGRIVQIPRDDYDQLLVLLKEQLSIERDYPNSEFIKVQRAAAQSTIDAYEQDEEWCPTKMTRLLEACNRLEDIIANRKELVVACKVGFSYIQAIAHRIPRPLGDLSDDRELVKAAIEKGEE